MNNVNYINEKIYHYIHQKLSKTGVAVHGRVGRNPWPLSGIIPSYPLKAVQKYAWILANFVQYLDPKYSKYL